MKKQPTNEQILRKLKELIRSTRDLDERLSEVEYVLDINENYRKRIKDKESTEDEKESGGGGEKAKNKPMKEIDEIDYGDDSLMNEVKGVVNELSKTKLGQSKEFKGPLEAIRRLTR